MRRPIAKSLVSLLAAAMATALSAAPVFALIRQVPDAPILRIETGTHGADVTGLAADEGGQLLATASYDKTVRLWRLADPSAPPRVIRAPIALDREGAFYAVALSPDGRRAAAGGWTGGWEGSGWSLYVFDTATGEMTTRIPAMPGRVLSLVFSHDGQSLAVGLKDKPGILLFNTRDWSVTARDDDQPDDVPSIDFDGGGRLVTASLNGTISLYGPGLTGKQVIKAPGGKEPAVLRFSPDGATIALGYADSSRVDLLSADDLHLLSSADTRGVDKSFIALGWSRDGQTLYGAGTYERGGRNPIRRWSRAGRGPARDFAVADAAVTRLQPLADGGLAFATQGGLFGVLDASMRLAWERRPGIADFRDQQDALRVSADGGIVQFSFERFGNSPLRFSLPAKSLSSDDGSDPPLVAALTETPEFAVVDWIDSEQPSLNGKALALKPHERSLSLAIAPDRQSFVLGTAWRVVRFDRAGNAMWSVQAPGAAWAAAVTGNGLFAVAAFGDGTIRWLRMSDGQTLLTLFVHATDRRWAAWTPSGYYIASPGGDTLIGWHVNRGAAQAADFFSAARFRDIYERPDVVEKVLGALDEGDAVRRGNLETGRSTQTRNLAALLPPVVSIRSPTEGTTIASPKVALEYDIRRVSAAPIWSLQVRADGRPIASIESSNSPIAERGRIEVFVPRRDTTLEMMVENAHGVWSEASAVRLHWSGPEDQIRPTLFILAIGIAEYRAPELKLQLAAKDANDFANLLRRQKGRAYRNVELRMLKDGHATGPEIKRALRWLASTPTNRDIAMLFMAGHGLDDPAGHYMFVPQEIGPREAMRKGLPYEEIRRSLANIAGRVFFFLDTCHSGAAWGEPSRSAADTSRIVNDLRSPEYGIVTFASSTGRQRSYESPEWGNGAFTKALVEGLSGLADYFHNGYVTTAELAAYISDRVPKLTNGRQTPAIGQPVQVDSVLVSLR
jgi:hypothetical protein